MDILWFCYDPRFVIPYNRQKARKRNRDDFPTVHFTAFSMEHSTAPGAELADAAMVKQLNPTLYLDEADVAKHWRIRSGHLAGNSRDPGDTPAQRGLRRGFCAAVGTSS